MFPFETLLYHILVQNTLLPWCLITQECEWIPTNLVPKLFGKQDKMLNTPGCYNKLQQCESSYTFPGQESFRGQQQATHCLQPASPAHSATVSCQHGLDKPTACASTAENIPQPLDDPHCLAEASIINRHIYHSKIISKRTLSLTLLTLFSLSFFLVLFFQLGQQV